MLEKSYLMSFEQERHLGTKKKQIYSKKEKSQLWLFLLTVAQLACCSRVSVTLLHAEHLNVGNGSFGSFNGESVFVSERELSGGVKR